MLKAASPVLPGLALTIEAEAVEIRIVDKKR